MAEGRSGTRLRRLLRFPLRLHVLMVFLALATVIALLLGAVADRQSQAALHDTVAVTFDSAAQVAIKELEATTKAARNAAAALVRHNRTPTFLPQHQDRKVEALATALETVPAISAAYLGWPDGDFLLVRPVGRHRAMLDAPETAWWLVQIVQGTTSRFEFLDSELVLVEQRAQTDFAFDPRTRPWFRLASASDDTVVTPAYVFFTTGEPGFSAARRSPTGAVAGVDISLWDLSDRLPRVSIAPSSRIAVIDAKGGVLAYSDPAALRAAIVDAQTDGEALAEPDILPYIGALNDPVLERLAARMLRNAARFEGELTVDGRAWMVRMEPLAGTEAFFLMAVPLDELRSVPGTMRQLLFQFFALAILLSVMAIWFAAGRLSHPVERAASAIRQLASLDLKGTPEGLTGLRELDELGEAVTTMKMSLAAYKSVHATVLDSADDLEILDGVLDSLLAICATPHGCAWIRSTGDKVAIVRCTLPGVTADPRVPFVQSVMDRIMAEEDPLVFRAADPAAGDALPSQFRNTRLLGVAIRRTDGQAIGGFVVAIGDLPEASIAPVRAFARFAARSAEVVLERRGLLAERDELRSETEQILATVADGIHVLGADGTILRQNPTAVAVLGFSEGEALGQDSHRLIHHHRADGSDYPIQECPIYQTLADGNTRVVDDDVFFRKDGSSFPVEYECSSLRDAAGAVRGAVVSFRDVSLRRREQMALRERVKELRCLYRVLELTLDAKMPLADVFTQIGETLTASVRFPDIAVARLRIDGDEFRTSGWQPSDAALNVPIAGVRVGAGFVEIGYLKEIPDGTPGDGPWLPEEKNMLEAVAAHISRLIQSRHIAEVLRHSERLSAIGELTGGIAHDFNNLLIVISGCAEILLEGPRSETEAHQLITSIENAASVGGELTSQLLAFARRQPLQPQVVAIDTILTKMEMMIAHAVGHAITCETSFAPGLWPVRIDHSQFQSAVLNLCINARDAMPNGGRLTIKAANVTLDAAQADWEPDFTPGDYMLLTISDTGSGMAPDLLRRAFEPFFTTKPMGKGSGLGLSMVYGFTKQSGGQIRIVSEPGCGTTVMLHFPRVHDDNGPGPEQKPDPAAAQGTERILNA